MNFLAKFLPFFLAFSYYVNFKFTFFPDLCLCRSSGNFIKTAMQPATQFDEVSAPILFVLGSSFIWP